MISKLQCTKFYHVSTKCEHVTCWLVIEDYDQDNVFIIWDKLEHLFFSVFNTFRVIYHLNNIYNPLICYYSAS